MHVLVAGCGWLGKALAQSLLARGDQVTGIRRTRAAADELSALGVRPLALDLSKPGAGAELPGDVEAIVACQSASADSAEAYRSAYVDANRELLEASHRLGARAFVYTGSTGVFGQRDGSDVDELTPVQPASPAAEVLVEGERLVLSAGGRLLRLSGLYGPGRTFLIDRVRSGAMALGPGDDAWTNWCHRDDAVQFITAALDRGRDGATYHGTDGSPARRREVVQEVAGMLGIEAPRAAGRGYSGPSRRILGDRTRQELGIELRYPSFREGVRALLGGAS